MVGQRENLIVEIVIFIDRVVRIVLPIGEIRVGMQIGVVVANVFPVHVFIGIDEDRLRRFAFGAWLLGSSLGEAGSLPIAKAAGISYLESFCGQDSGGDVRAVAASAVKDDFPAFHFSKKGIPLCSLSAQVAEGKQIS